MTTERPDRGARALAQGIAIGISGEPNGLGLTWNEAVTVGHRIAGHLVGPGAFLPDAAELERLRRIEAAAPMLLIAIDNAGLESLAEAADDAGAEVPDWQERLWDAADAYRLATEPEGSAQP